MNEVRVFWPLLHEFCRACSRLVVEWDVEIWNDRVRSAGTAIVYPRAPPSIDLDIHDATVGWFAMWMAVRSRRY